MADKDREIKQLKEDNVSIVVQANVDAASEIDRCYKSYSLRG